jgi:hypothetical protein
MNPIFNQQSSILNRFDLETLMSSHGILADATFFADDLYLLPSLDWLTGDFVRGLQAFFQLLDMADYTAEQCDCDDFARGAAFYASTLHNRFSDGSNRRTALAFGEFAYKHRDGYAHAINCILCATSEPVGARSTRAPLMQLVFFEPQAVLKNANPVVTLTPEEKMNCRAYRF